MYQTTFTFSILLYTNTAFWGIFNSWIISNSLSKLHHLHCHVLGKVRSARCPWGPAVCCFSHTMHQQFWHSQQQRSLTNYPAGTASTELVCSQPQGIQNCRSHSQCSRGAQGHAPAHSLFQHNTLWETSFKHFLGHLLSLLKKNRFPRAAFPASTCLKPQSSARGQSDWNCGAGQSQQSQLPSPIPRLQLWPAQLPPHDGALGFTEQLQYQFLTVLPQDSSSTPCSEATLHTSTPGASVEWTAALSSCAEHSKWLMQAPASDVLIPWGSCVTGVHNRKKGSSRININLIIPDTASPHLTPPPLRCLLSHATGTSLFPKQAQENQMLTDTKVSEETKNVSSSIFSFGLYLLCINNVLIWR